MQAVGIQGAFASAAKTASRCGLEDANDPVVVDQLDKLDRWHAARRKGLGTEDAARAVGVPRAPLSCWGRRQEGCLIPAKTGPRVPRRPGRSPARLRKPHSQIRRQGPEARAAPRKRSPSRCANPRIRKGREPSGNRKPLQESPGLAESRSAIFPRDSTRKIAKQPKFARSFPYSSGLNSRRRSTTLRRNPLHVRGTVFSGRSA